MNTETKHTPEIDVDFIVTALNAYWNSANITLQRRDLGDIERRNWEFAKEKSKEQMDTLEDNVNSFLSRASDLEKENEDLKLRLSGKTFFDEKEVMQQRIDRLEKVNAELLEALKPFDNLAQEVLIDVHRPNLERVLYAFNKAEIKYSDLRKVIEVIQKSKGQ